MILLNNIINNYLGGMDNLLYSLLVLMALDYLTEILTTTCYHKLYGKVFIHNLARKIVILILIIATNTLDGYLLQDNSTTRAMTIIFYISKEGTSILNNANKLGIPVPHKLKNIIQYLLSKSLHQK